MPHLPTRHVGVASTRRRDVAVATPHADITQIMRTGGSAHCGAPLTVPALAMGIDRRGGRW